MDYPFKRERGENWSFEQKMLLLNLIRNNIKIIENKAQDGSLLRHKKNLWGNITQQFNRRGHNLSTARLKQQWTRLKINAKKSIALYNKHVKGTSGGSLSPPLSTIDEEILSIISYKFEKDTNDFDSDEINVPAPIPKREICTVENSFTDGMLESSFTNEETKSSEDPLALEIAPEEILEADSSYQNITLKPRCKRFEEKMTEYEAERLKMDKTAFEKREEREREIHELQVLKLNYEIQLLKQQLEKNK